MGNIRSVLIAAIVLATGNAAALPPIEAYGELPFISDVSISPDGEKLAYLANVDGIDLMSVFKLGEGTIMAVNTDNTNARYVRFANDRYAIVGASEATRAYGGRFDYSAAFSVNLEKQDFVQLLRTNDELYPAQSGLGKIVGHVAGEDRVFMPAYMRGGGDPIYSLLKVDLDNGRSRNFVRGRSTTIDWFVDQNGKILAREDYDNRRNEYKLWTRPGRDWELVYETESEFVPFSVVGVKQDKSALIVIGKSRNGYDALYELSFDGNFSPEIFVREDASVERVITDANRIVYGVEYGGMRPSYDFYDADLTQAMQRVQNTFADSAVYFMGWGEEFDTFLIFVTGGGSSGEYYLYDRVNNELKRTLGARPKITQEFVAPADVIEYKARDGLTIPSILTWPLNRTPEERQQMPLIVMPHGGPEAYDSVRFDWMAQYFASRGYLVLQPNFRGSDGFGVDFLLAGRGEWGLKMQDDVTDGVQALIRGGYVDPERVCIIGASYGGYSALAGGAFTPDLYQCVAAIAPVSDLPRMLDDERRDRGRDHWVYSYWQAVIGDRREEREKLDQISPANHAASFMAPVLLIHGRDDTVVPIRQSEIMERALRREDKNVRLVWLRGEDHYLSSSETRLETLKLLDAFVREHLGPAL
ncbi:S9 family peptidase [Parvularcula sp. IMCC14364]|uniref:alpha/beta hydrolase family protein n=1 Tax=Parvularcula sp. IMCC14364 TaxID=3067902 RepID=UPI002741D1E0|nr:S9 family peptidase [Parvularcula sp. IMCC14364]